MERNIQKGSWCVSAEHPLSPRPHLSEGHVVLHVTVVLREDKARQDVSNTRTDARSHAQ